MREVIEKEAKTNEERDSLNDVIAYAQSRLQAEGGLADNMYLRTKGFYDE